MIMIKRLLVVAVVLLLSACASLQEELKSYVKSPEVTYKSISVGKLAMELIELTPTFNIANPNGFSIPVNTLTYEFYLNNNKMLSGETQEMGTLPANGNKDVTLSIDLSQETLIALQQLLFKDKKLNYQVKGDVNAMGLTIPFEKSATLYVPEVKIRDLKVTNASFAQLDIMLNIDIENKNDLNLPLENISYSASSKEHVLFEGLLKSQEIAPGTNNIQLPITIKPTELFASLFTMLLSPELPLRFEVKSPLFNNSYEHTLNMSSLF